MRVIAGNWKGRKLSAPDGDIARPTGDRVKEAMFSMLGLSSAESRFLDLFAGSGALGIEALSRGATHVVFVDSHRKSIQAIRDNLGQGIAERASVWHVDWKTGIEQFSQQYNDVDWVFVDPPYAQNLWVPVLIQLTQSGCLVRGGVVCEHPKTTNLPERVGAFVVNKSKVYGSVALTFYRKIEITSSRVRESD